MEPFFQASIFPVTYGGSVVPESTHQDTVGTFARTVRDAVYALDAIYGVDPRDNYTLAQTGKTPSGGYSQFLTNRDSLQNATFGLPWESFWALASEEQQTSLLGLIELLQSAGATVINGTELPNYQTIVSPDGWDWFVYSLPARKRGAFTHQVCDRDYGAIRGYPNESEFTYVKVSSLEFFPYFPPSNCTC